jgi:hypothetical protein
MPITLSELEDRVRAGEIQALMAELARGDAADRLLAIALRREKYALCTLPELTLPTMYRACFGNAVLQPLLDAWEKQWVKQQRGPWLRALMPQHWGLESAMSRRFVDEALSWPTPRYQATKKWDDAHLTVLDQNAKRSWMIPYAQDDSITCVAAMDDDNVLVGGWYCDGDGVVCRVNLASQQIVWRAPLINSIDSILVTATGQIIATQRRCGHLLRPKDGTVICTFNLPRGSHRLSQDRKELLVVSGGVCRSFALDQLLTTKHPSDRRETGFTAAEFSCDGELLVCGLMMFNARTGQQIALLDADSGEGYIEGGPPERGRRVVPSGFIETKPNRGTTRWNRRGELVHTAETRFAHWHELVFANDGRHLAIQDRSNKRIELRDVDSQVVKATSQFAAQPGFEWIGDQNAVAYITEEGFVRLMFVDGRDQSICDRPGAHKLYVSCDGHTLATISAATASIWSLGDVPRHIGDVALCELQQKEHGIAESLHGHHGFRIRSHPWRGEYQRGWFKIIDDNTGKVTAQTSCDGPLHADPTGRRWASRTELFALDM